MPAGRARTPRIDEIELLWAAASPYSDPARVVAAAEGSDIHYVLETAAAHRLAPLVLRSLRTAGVVVDPRSRGALQAKAWEARAALALPAAAGAALVPLQRAGLEPLLLKGLALVHRYPAPGLRPMDDIDLLLPPRFTASAKSVLTRGGWVQGAHAGRDPRYDLAFQHDGAPGVPLELHYQFIEWRERSPRLDAEHLWSTRQPATVFGHPAFVLPAEIELMTLIIHAAKGFHMFDRLLWIADLVVVTRATDLDWHELGRLATVTRRRVATAVALRLAKRLGAEVPADLCKIAPAIAHVRALEALLDPSHPFLPRGNPWWLSYAFVDSIAAKGRLALGEFVRPPRRRRRRGVLGDLAKLAYHGASALARAQLRPRERPS